MDKIYTLITGKESAEYTIEEFGKARADFLAGYKSAFNQ
jgi:hypothetical protein